MLTKVISRLPASWIHGAGQLQFKIPVLGPVIGYFGRKVLAGQGVIRYGVGSGLKFDASGGTCGYLFGTAEPEEQEALARYLKPGGVFYDIGANVGFFATLAGKLVGPGGKVYAFEPSPAMAECVRRNAASNNFTHLTVVEAAVSSAPGEAELQLGDISGKNSIVFGRTEGAVKVRVVSIDHLRQSENIAAPTVVMVDAEGAEIEILKGMAQTIRESRPVIMVEVHWLGQPFIEYVRENILSHGYTMRPLVGTEIPQGKDRYHAILEPTGSATA